MIPNWASDVGELNDFVARANGCQINIPRQASRGKSIHIGVIDSAYALPDEFTAGFDVRESADNAFVTVDTQDTTGHALKVFNRISTYSADATFTLYQAVKEDQQLSLTAFSAAISAAIDDGVDILNISAGRPWEDLVSTNPAALEAKRAIEAGITVVAAAGNWYPDRQDSRPPVHCPAALDEVIAVGGLETVCPVEVGTEPADEKIGPYYAVPSQPNEDISELTPTDSAFCGSNGCIGGESCITNQEEREWEYNPLPTGDKPDVLAPMHIPLSVDGEGTSTEKLTCGTSFAAPIVSASLANIYGELIEDGREMPKPHEVRYAARSGGKRIDSGKMLKYDAMGTRRALGVS